MTLGEDVAGPELAGKVNDVTYLLTGTRPPLSDPALAGAELGRVLADDQVLLVVDDVWSRPQLEPFLTGGTRTLRLVTTRRHSVLPDPNAVIDVEAMEPVEAEELLTAGLSDTPRRLLLDLLAATGRWPVLVALVNGAARADQTAGRNATDAPTQAARDPHDTRAVIPVTTRVLAGRACSKRAGQGRCG